MTFEEFLKRSTSIPRAAQSTLLESQIRHLESQRREFDKYLWQAELQKWKKCDLEDDDFRYLEQDDTIEEEWGTTRNSIWITSSPYRKAPMYFYADESHMSDFGEKIEITIDKKRLENDIAMSFDDVMGFGGTYGK